MKNQVNFAAVGAEVGREEFQALSLERFFGGAFAQDAIAEMQRRLFAAPPVPDSFDQRHAMVLAGWGWSYKLIFC